MLALFETFPRLKINLPRIPLGQFPTPVQELSQLSNNNKHLSIFVKNDGLSGTPYGGNKIRKLEFLLAQARQRGALTTLTFGFAGSNHALASSVYARQVGLHPISVLLPQANAHYVRHNLLLGLAQDAEIHQPTSTAAALMQILRVFTQQIFQTGKLPYIIPPGGSSPLGTIGYVNAAFELKQQIMAGELPEPDCVYVALGTMGTAVGLHLGFLAAGINTRLVPVRVVAPQHANADKYCRLFRKTYQLLRKLEPDFPVIDVTAIQPAIEHNFFGHEYACFTEECVQAVQQAAQGDQLHLEGTYTGKTMAALLAHLQNHAAGETILFWNTCNAHDLQEHIQALDYHALPESLHTYFEKDVQPLDQTG